MASKIVAHVKKHKIIYGVSFVALIGILFLARGAGSSSSTTVTVGPTPQEIDASTQLGLAQIAATQQNQATQAAAQTRMSEINANQTVATLQLQNQNLEGIRQAEVAIYTVGQQAAIRAAEIASAERTAENTNATALAQSTILANLQNQLGLYDLQATQATAGAQVQAAQIEANATVRAVREQSRGNIISSVVGGLFSLFSDTRLKRDVQKICTDQYGVTWYSYRYNETARRILPSINTNQRFVGVLAQDLLSTRYRNAVSMFNGYYTVDYENLPMPPNAVAQRIAA